MTPNQSSQEAHKVCALAPVVPVIVVDDVSDARPLAEALMKGGLKVLEVTLRTEVALDAINAMSKIEGTVTGAGTLLNREEVIAAKNAGATFGVAPGSTDEVLDAALEVGLPMLPGAVTSTEVMNLLGKGYDMLKFFPAELAGGTKMLKAFGSVFGNVRFCPTGGVSENNAPDYLALPNIVCVGGSWVADKALIKSAEWDEITKRAIAASKFQVSHV